MRLADPAVRAAGGVVLRRTPDGIVEIVLVHRPAYDDWTFPKGKLHENETEEEAALREVEEETRLHCELVRELGQSSYRDSNGRPKTVRYWEMSPVAGVLGPANEIDDARWVTIADARERLSYARDRELLAHWCGRRDAKT